MKRNSNPHKVLTRSRQSRRHRTSLGALKLAAQGGDDQAKRAVEYMEYLIPKPYRKSDEVKTPSMPSMHTCNTHNMKKVAGTKTTVSLQCVCGKRFDVGRKTYALMKEKAAETSVDASKRPASHETDPSSRPSSSVA